MRVLIPCLAILAVATGNTPAQTTPNRHLFFPAEDNSTSNRFLDGVTFATRLGGAFNADVECFADVSAAQFRGVGATSNTACAVAGQVFVIQDQQQTTQDSFKIIVRKAVAPDGLPDTTATGIYAISAAIQLPPPPGSGPIAWQYSLTWQTAVAVNCENGYFVGVELLPGASTSDFTLAQSAGPYTAGTPAAGDNPRTPVPKIHACRVDRPALTATRNTTLETLAVVTLATTPTLTLGNVDPTHASYKSFGVGGLYPSTTRADGLVGRVEDTSAPGGVVLLFMARPSYIAGGAAVPGVTGGLWVLPTFFFIGTAAIPAAGPFVTEVSIAPNLPALTGTSLVFFGLTADAQLTTLRLTNTATVSL